MGHGYRRGIPCGRALPARLVVADGAEPVHRARRPGLHHGRIRDGRDPQPEDPRTMSVLSVEDLRVTYSTKGGDVPAVRGVNFAIEKGEVLGLAGESGCGKSTIAGAILRLHSAQTKIEGKLELDGKDILALTPGKLRAVRWTGASIVFQGALHALNPVQRIGAQIAEAINVHGMAPEKQGRGRADVAREGRGEGGDRARRCAARAGGAAAAPHRGLPARTLRGSEAAGDD